MFDDCLYFNLSSLTRRVTEVWRVEFARLGLSPSHGYLLFAMASEQGLAQKDYGELLDLDASTVNRFIDTLIGKGYVSKEGAGRASSVSVTAEGKKEYRRIKNVMARLREKMTEALGETRFEGLVEDLKQVRKTLA